MTDGEIGRNVRSDDQAARSRVSAASGGGGSATAQERGGERPRLSGGHQRDVAFVALLRAGDPSAFGLLFDTWIDPIYDRISHRSFTTADVADLSASTFATTHRRLTEQSTADPFRVVLFRAARQESVAAADRRVDLHMPVGPYAEDRLVRGADAAGLAADPAVAALLWQAADVLGEQARDVLDLHHRHEFSPVEIAAVMNLTPDAIEDILRKVPKGLTAVVRSMVVWRQGVPAHDELVSALDGADTFDTTTVRTIAEHQRTCDACREAGKLSVDPLAVFKAIPLAVAPVGFKEIVVERLQEIGLPIEGSVSYRATVAGAAAAGAAGVAAAATIDDRGDVPPVDDEPAAITTPEAPESSDPSDPSDASDETDSSESSHLGAAALGGAAVVAGIAAGGAAETDAEETGSPWDPLIRPVTTTSSDRDKAKAKAAMAATTATAVSAEGVATATAAPTSAWDPDPAPAPAPSSGSSNGSSGSSDGSTGSGGNRKLLYAGIAIGVVILLIGAVVLTQGGKKSDKSSLTASGSSTTTVTTVSSSSSSIVTSTTAVPVTGDTAPPDTGSPDSSAAPTTKAPQAPITIPGQAVTTTTAEPYPDLTGTVFSLSRVAMVTNTAAITLTWDVKSDKAVTVSISGPGFSSTDLSGGPTPVCPVPIDAQGRCAANASPPTNVYTYVLKVTDHLGRVLTRNVQFTVTHS